MKLAFIVSFCTLPLLGCVDSDTDESSGLSEVETEARNLSSKLDTEITQTLTAISQDVVAPNLVSFLESTQHLKSTIDQYCSDLESLNEENSRHIAKNAWQSTVSIWQNILAAQLGPITENGDLLGGRIYSWPEQVSTCTVDRQVILGQAAGYQIETGPRQARGLDALEYLLFNSNLNHTCSSLIPETQNWNTFSASDRRSQRCAYAQLAATDLQGNAETLSDAWNNFQKYLINAGTGDSHFESKNDALNQVTDALFYLDKEVKDRKLAAVLGLNNTSDDCNDSTCIELRESPWSENSLINIQNNLIGFKHIFIASLAPQASAISDQLGFDYQLAIRNFPDLSQSILNQVDNAILFIDGLDQTINDYVMNIESSDLTAACVNASSNRVSTEGLEVCALHGMIKGITDLLKTDFITLMTLSLPERVEGDND